MDREKTPTKETLLAEIETLIAYGREEPTINPTLLAYLSLDDLRNMKDHLLAKANLLSEEDKVWLEQFKRYD